MFFRTVVIDKPTKIRTRSLALQKTGAGHSLGHGQGLLGADVLLWNPVPYLGRGDHGVRVHQPKAVRVADCKVEQETRKGANKLVRRTSKLVLHHTWCPKGPIKLEHKIRY